MPKRLDTATFVLRASTTHNNRYTYNNSKYINSSTPIAITCVTHGDFYQTPVNHITNQSGCPQCAGRVRKTTDQFIEQVINKHGQKFTFEHTNYINDSTPVRISCVYHGEFAPIPSNLLQGHGCMRCRDAAASTKNRHTLDQFIKKAISAHGDTYDYSQVNYVNNKTHVNIGCKKHGLFRQTPTNHVDLLTGCPNCNLSKGELQVRNWLIKNQIQFTQQQTFDNCKYVIKLRFDFYIPSLHTAIEYQGAQHYTPHPNFWKTSDTLEIVQARDAVKRQYALEQNMTLIEIPYTVSNISAYLTQRIQF